MFGPVLIESPPNGFILISVKLPNNRESSRTKYLSTIPQTYNMIILPNRTITQTMHQQGKICETTFDNRKYTATVTTSASDFRPNKWHPGSMPSGSQGVAKGMELSKRRHEIDSYHGWQTSGDRNSLSNQSSLAVSESITFSIFQLKNQTTGFRRGKIVFYTHG